MSFIGDRMKRYERCNDSYLPRRIPVIIRVDGKAFHTIVKKYFGKGWSASFSDAMIEVAKKMQHEIQGCNFCYSQSDEISFLLTDYKTIDTDAWLGYCLQKLVSISSALASSIFMYYLNNETTHARTVNEPICFDSRAFSLPMDDVCNYFIWRQLDAERNAISFTGREHFSAKQLHKKSSKEIRLMLNKEGVELYDFPTIRKRGFCIIDGEVDLNIPEFTTERSYIEKHVYVRED